MEMALKYFLPSMQQHAVQPGAMFTEANIRSIFFSLADIYQFNLDFCAKLEKRLNEWPQNQHFADIFIDTVRTARQQCAVPKLTNSLKIPQMSFYGDYINNFDHATEVYAKLFSQKQFQDFMRGCMSKAHTKLDLPALLIQPVQRMPRYQLLMRELLKLTEKDHVDYKNIKDALQTAQDVNVAINKKKKELEHRNKIAAVERTIVGLPSSLVAPDRLFVRSGPMQFESHKKWVHVICS
jgi:hypothetical protein